MPKRASFPAVAAAAPKRQKLEVAVGDEVVVCHSAPRAKRLFAGMRGTVASTTGLTLDVRFELPKASIALYSDFLGAADEASCTLKKLSIAHVARPTPRTKRLPFHLAAVQTRIVDLLRPKSLINLLATAQGVVRDTTLAGCLVAAVRRALRASGEGPNARAALEQTKKDWAGWRRGVYLKRLAYTPVRDELLAQLTTKADGGLHSLNGEAMVLLAHVGAKFDEAIIGPLLRVKQALVRQRFCDYACNDQLRQIIGEGGKKQPRGVHAIKVLVKTFAASGDAIGWPWLHSLLGDISRTLSVETCFVALGRTCYQAAVQFCLRCIEHIGSFPDPPQAAGRIADVMVALRCHDHAVFRRIIRMMQAVEYTTVELSMHRWTAEPHSLGLDVAAAWDLIIFAWDIQTFACGACLLRLMPCESLWPIANSILSDYNTRQTLKVCGYPKAPTPFFTLVLLAMVKRDPAAFQPYIEGRLRACCGEGQAAWFLRNVSDAMEAARPVEKVMPRTSPLTRSSKRRKCVSERGG